MEVNDYLPSRVRVLSSDNPAKAEPDFVTNPFDTDLEFTEDEINLIDNLKDNNKSDELFQFLFIKQCNKLNEILPELFEKTNDYTELLLNVSFTDKDGVVYHLVHDISEDDFNVEKEGQVEIIGWLYQYYNIEPKDKVFGRPSGQKIRKEDVPAATQLFTPDWIVRYMVENSLGRLVISGQCVVDSGQCLVGSEKELAEKFGWKYYLPEAEQTSEVSQQIKLTTNHSSLPTLKLIDPCMGSGHILVYAFDVFMDIYRMQGYTDREAVRSILENNLFGLEIDDRATQLAYFAVMMKARSYDRRFFTRGIRPNLCSIQESNSLNTDYLELFGDLKPTAQKLVDEFIDAKEYGSILNLRITAVEIAQLESKYAEIDNTIYDNIFDTIRQVGLRTAFVPIIKQAKIMVQKYSVVCTNPPYMVASGMSVKLYEYVNKHFSKSKSDLFSVFIEKCLNYSLKYGYTSMITMQSWMFLRSFQELRELLEKYTLINMAHLGARAFDEISGEVVQTTSFVLLNDYIKNYNGTVLSLVDGKSEKEKSQLFLKKTNTYIVDISKFDFVPEKKYAYWLSESELTCLSYDKVGDLFDVKSGLSTGDNDFFLRQWFEINSDEFSFINNKTKKWVPYNKGLATWRWYGMNMLVVRWENNGRLLRQNKKAVFRNPSYYFKEGITWTGISSGKGSFRYSPKGYIFDSNKGPMIFVEDGKLYYLMALLDSKVSVFFTKVFNQSTSLQIGDVQKIPYAFSDNSFASIDNLAKENIEFAKKDWDSFETSWDFSEHPFVRWSKELWDATSIEAYLHHYYRGKHIEVKSPLELCFMLWQGECWSRFENLKRNEETLNSIFINIYGLQDELTPDIEDKDVTVRKADLQLDMRSFISYAVGCMFGRYSLDKEGLVFAGGDFDDVYMADGLFPSNTLYPSNNLTPKEPEYTGLKNADGVTQLSYRPDYDNCIPITDTAYFDDDIVGRFVEFVKVVFGEDTLEANLEFVAKALGNKGNTCRDVIRNYFLNDFFKDHCKIYQKRPIYWLFDSGKQNGFKALVYMHRWNADTIGNMRVEYLHRIQRTYEKEIEREQDTIDNTTNNRDRAAATKRKEKLLKQLKEAKDYDAKVAHLALSRPDIDLDDGVKVNYEKVQTAQDGKKLQILAKI